MGFPTTRQRRLRVNAPMRRLVCQTKLSADNFVYPLFTCPGTNTKKPISSMTGCFHFSPDKIAEEAIEVASLGIPAILLFGLPEQKDAVGSQAYSEDSTVCQAIRQIKKAVPDLLVITDVCLCAYTDHGHCGLIKEGKVDNDPTLELLAKMALTHAKAGADMIAPSDMMDGRVGKIRSTLDAAGFSDIPIMSYAAKYASAYYGPFREAAHSTPQQGDRKSYQMDPGNSREAIREMKLDIEEGADIVMVKPALLYLDVICRASQTFDVPIAAYHVSGQYMMIQAAAEKGLIDRDAVMLETLTSIKRAGADIVITYFAKAAASLLKA
ncbi:MAG: porphobilinogen synthase [Phycisphaerae bacterium]|nr:porphobilinogen synthase [Phycisphaerae bacterium]